MFQKTVSKMHCCEISQYQFEEKQFMWLIPNHDFLSTSKVIGFLKKLAAVLMKLFSDFQ